MTSYIKSSTELTLYIGSIFPAFIIIFYFVVLKKPELNNKDLLTKDLDSDNEENILLFSNPNIDSSSQPNQNQKKDISEKDHSLPLSFKEKLLSLPVKNKKKKTFFFFFFFLITKKKISLF